MMESKIARAGPRMPCKPTAARVPTTLARAAETKATKRLVARALQKFFNLKDAYNVVDCFAVDRKPGIPARADDVLDLLPVVFQQGKGKIINISSGTA